MTWIIGLLTRWGLPERVRRPVAWLGVAGLLIALCGLLWAIWLARHDREVIERHEDKVQAKVEARATAAATAAASASAETKSKVEATNDQARDAAARSVDDPLGDGLRSLRSD